MFSQSAQWQLLPWRSTTLSWSWTKDVREHVDIDVDIDIDLKSTGLVEVEKLQIFFGNVTATSNVHDIQNHQYDPGFTIEYVYCRPVIICDSFDATVDLPSVISAATAVGQQPEHHVRCSGVSARRAVRGQYSLQQR